MWLYAIYYQRYEVMEVEGEYVPDGIKQIRQQHPKAGAWIASVRKIDDPVGFIS